MIYCTYPYQSHHYDQPKTISSRTKGNRQFGRYLVFEQNQIHGSKCLGSSQQQPAQQWQNRTHTNKKSWNINSSSDTDNDNTNSNATDKIYITNAEAQHWQRCLDIFEIETSLWTLQGSCESQVCNCFCFGERVGFRLRLAVILDRWSPVGRQDFCDVAGRKGRDLLCSRRHHLWGSQWCFSGGGTGGTEDGTECGTDGDDGWIMASAGDPKVAAECTATCSSFHCMCCCSFRMIVLLLWGLRLVGWICFQSFGCQSIHFCSKSLLTSLSYLVKGNEWVRLSFSQVPNET